jgi:hypothetical protein
MSLEKITLTRLIKALENGLAMDKEEHSNIAAETNRKAAQRDALWVRIQADEKLLDAMKEAQEKIGPNETITFHC